MSAQRDAGFEAVVRRLRVAPAGFQPPEAPDPASSALLPDSAETQRIEFLKARIARGSRVLDLGCGRGEILHFLRRRLEIDYLGLERQPEFIAECRRIGLRVVPADFNDLEDPALRHACSQRWDAVLVIDSMVYWRCPAAVLAALQDRCGVVYVSVNNAAQLRQRLRLLGGRIDELPNVRAGTLSADWFTNRWSVEGFRAWCGALGYRCMPIARRSVDAKYLPLGPLPGIFARSVLFELRPA